MPNVIADISMSLDGFVTGEGADEQHGLGLPDIGRAVPGIGRDHDRIPFAQFRFLITGDAVSDPALNHD